MVRNLPVPDMAAAPLLPDHLMAVPQPPAVIPTFNVKETKTIMEIPSLSGPHDESLTETIHALEQSVIPKSEQVPTAALAVAPPKPPRRHKSHQNEAAKLDRQPEAQISLTHHEARCSICNHPQREAIDEAFLHWQRPTAIAHEFQLRDRRIIYRHVHALGLFHQRAGKSRRSLEFIMEQAETVTATADSVIRAVRAHACLGEDGRWTEPRKEVLITHKLIDTRADQNVDLTPAPPTKRPKLIDTLFRHSTRLFASVF